MKTFVFVERINMHCIGFKGHLRSRILSSFFLFVLPLMACHYVVAETGVRHVDKDSGEGPPRSKINISYTPVYQMNTDLKSGGEFDIQRHFLRFHLNQPMNRQWAVGLGLSFDYEQWDFSGIASLPGIDLWDEIYRPGLSIPIFYSPTREWRLGVILSIDLAGASGAEISDSVSYGTVVSAAYVFNRDLMLGVGIGLFERLDQTEIFPYVVINWKINDQFRISNPFRAGPVGPAGIELTFMPAGSWELGVGGTYRSYRFRLDDSSTIADGIAENTFWAPFVRLGWKIGKKYRFDFNGGVLSGGTLSIEDANGNALSETDYDTAPFVGATLKGSF